MSAQSVARKYANALHQVAAKNGSVDRIGRDLSDLVGLLDGSPDLHSVFETPLVPARKKRALVEQLVAASPELAEETGRLLVLLADRDRLMLIGAIARAFEARVMAANRIVAADVVTAVPLGEARKAQLAEALGAATGQRVILSERVDPSILGGVVAHVGSLVFDGSIVRQLERMRQKLVAEA
jgi:F-type H+-transporting ATPase subunit delta